MKLFGKEISIVDKKFRKNKSHYILQCMMATAAVVGILLAMDSVFKEVMLASFGATAFLIFAMPHLRTSQERSVLGGYIIGMILGIALHHFAAYIYELTDFKLIYSIMAGLAVGLSLLIMTMTNAEHPPAAGLSLGLVLQGYHAMSLVIVFASVVVLMIIKRLLKNWLINLY
ncbi:MAG: HPP family protein [Eubacteriales bacterium]